jgi:hypothetical protein
MLPRLTDLLNLKWQNYGNSYFLKRFTAFLVYLFAFLSESRVGSQRRGRDRVRD